MRKIRCFSGIAAAFSAARRVRTLLRSAAWPKKGSVVRLIWAACITALLFRRADAEALRADARRFDVFNADCRKVMESRVFSFYRGTPVLWHSMARRSSFAAEDVIFLDRKLQLQACSDAYREQTLRHEWGHTVQERMLGRRRWLRAVAVPSVRGFRQDLSEGEYFRQPWERSADFYGSAQRRDTGEATPSLQYLDGWLGRSAVLPPRKRKNASDDNREI